MDYDPMMEHSIKVTRIITVALEPLQQMFDELKRKKQQLPITMFFQKVEKQTMTTIDNPNHQLRLLLTLSNHRHRLLVLQLRRSRCQDHLKQMIFLLTHNRLRYFLRNKCKNVYKMCVCVYKIFFITPSSLES
jgi:hypothetical protein